MGKHRKQAVLYFPINYLCQRLSPAPIAEPAVTLAAAALTQPAVAIAAASVAEPAVALAAAIS